MGKTKVTDLTVYIYNSPTDFNTYSIDLYDMSYNFYGGYKVAVLGARKPNVYWALGITQVDGTMLVRTKDGERLTNSFQTPIRCVLNFTK